jgi:hypothetical protein
MTSFLNTIAAQELSSFHYDWIILLTFNYFAHPNIPIRRFANNQMPSTYWFANPYYLKSGRSPLYHEYEFPSASPDNGVVQGAIAFSGSPKTSPEEALSPRTPPSSPQSSACESASPPTTSSSTTPSSPCDSKITMPTSSESCPPILGEDEEECDSSYAHTSSNA